MVAGARLRRRRRALTGAGAAAAVALVTAGALLVTSLVAGRSASGPANLGSHAVATSPSPWSSDRVGELISSGTTDSAGELVFSIVPINDAQIPQTHFGVVAGHRKPDGTVTDDLAINEVTGSDSAPGFHVIEAPTDINGVMIPEFGYYAGAVARITGLVGSVTVDAHLAPAPGRPGIVVFWFDGDTRPRDITALDARGQWLPAGDTTVGSG